MANKNGLIINYIFINIIFVCIIIFTYVIFGLFVITAYKNSFEHDIINACLFMSMITSVYTVAWSVCFAKKMLEDIKKND